MRRKDFMLGLGVGIVFSAAITMIPSSSTDTLTDEEIKTRAMKLGMVEKEDALAQVLKQNATATPTAIASAEPEDVTETEEVKVTQTPEVTSTPVTTFFANYSGSTTASSTKTPSTQKVKATEKPKSTETPKKEKDNVSKEPEYVTFTIQNGMWSEEIASRMYELELVDDAKKFDKFLSDNGYGSIIKSGTFKIPKGSTYKDIAEIITN